MAVFYILPAFGKDTGSFMLILLIITPILCFIVSLLYGAGRGFDLFYSLIIALLFVPAIFIYYNGSAWIYIVIYTVITLAGCVLGSFVYNKKSEK